MDFRGEIIMAKSITDADWQSVVVESELPVLVDFWATWCGPCRSLSPVIDELSEAYEGKVVIVKYNVDDNYEYSNKYGIRSIPALLFFKGGEVVKTINGAVAKNVIEDALNEIM
jgi:thioredoxin 1